MIITINFLLPFYPAWRFLAILHRTAVQTPKILLKNIKWRSAKVPISLDLPYNVIISIHTQSNHHKKAIYDKMTETFKPRKHSARLYVCTSSQQRRLPTVFSTIAMLHHSHTYKYMVYMLLTSHFLPLSAVQCSKIFKRRLYIEKMRESLEQDLPDSTWTLKRPGHVTPCGDKWQLRIS